MAGNLENDSVVFNITDNPHPKSMIITENLGYGLMTIYNKTHI